MGLSLSEVVIEQAQLVAELLASGELKLNEPAENSKEETAKPQGIKTKKGSSLNSSNEISHQDEGEENKNKKIKVSNSLDEGSSSSTSVSNPTTVSLKVKGVGSSDVASKIKAASPFHFFLSTITSVAATKSEPLSLTFAEMLDPSLGILKESIQINFMVELGWLLAQYCAHKVQ